MKKIIILLVAAFSFTAGFAQNRQYDRNQPYPVYSNNGQHGNQGYPGNNDGYNKRDRRYDDRGYDNRDYGRRDDRYSRRRNMPAPPPPPPVIYEQPRPNNNFGKGVAVGVIGAVILGAILSH